ncbi:glycosyltransferase family 2 protein [Nocardiopsis nanhaiensis]
MASLSVIIPAKDVEPYIGDTLNSLVRNDRPDFEYIVIDDGSSDRTSEIVDGFRARLPGLRLLHNEHPTGASHVRNQGLQESSGHYITYLDGDDWLSPGYLPKAVDALRDLNVDFVRTDHVQVFGSRRVLHTAPEGRVGRRLDPRGGILPCNLFTMVDYPNAWSGIFDRRLSDQGLLDFDASLLSCEDRLWTWRLHLHARSYARVPLIGVFYRRQVSGSLTQVRDSRQLHFLDAMQQIVDEVTAEAAFEPYVAKALRTYCALLHFHNAKGVEYTPDLRKTLLARSRQAMRGLPQDRLDQVIREMGGQRARFLRGLHDPAQPLSHA